MLEWGARLGAGLGRTGNFACAARRPAEWNWWRHPRSAENRAAETRAVAVLLGESPSSTGKLSVPPRGAENWPNP